MAEKDDEPPSDDLSRKIGLDDEGRAVRLAFYDIGHDDEARLSALGAFREQHLDRIVAELYAHLLRFPPLEELLRAEPGRVAVLQSLQREYFLRLAEGRIDAAYLESRLRVGNAHQRAGIGLEWYIGAFSLFLRLWMRAIADERGADPDLMASLESLVKIVFLDISLAVDTYIHGGFVGREYAAELQRATAMAEEALRVKQGTERLKDELTSMVVHDLKNPVNGIAMMVQLALRKGDDLPEAHKGHLRQIEHTCREMTRLIQNLLEISRIEEGKMEVEREPVSPAEVAAEVASEYGPLAERADRRLRVELRPALPPVLADRALLKRVLVNLVTNALRHSGSPEVRITAVAEPGTKEVVLHVIDQGRGIPDEDRECIFEKFRSVRRPASEAPTGDTGVGLAFCRLAVELMGGRIGVRSSPDEETVFWVALPRAEALRGPRE